MARKFQYKVIPSRWLEEEGHRLDCGPYMSGAIEARETLTKHNCEPLLSLTTGHNGGIFNGPRFPRIYVNDRAHGVPFLGSTDILDADLFKVSLLSKKQVEDKPALVLDEGWTLITCSGTIGRMAYSRSDMKGMAGSQHFMRVVPNTDIILPGFLYAYLNSKFGVPLVISGTYGAIIQHIEPRHIADLPVPRLGQVEEDAHALVKRAAQLRVDASTMLLNVTTQLKQEFGFTEDLNSDSIHQVVKSVEILKSRRLDAYFFNHRARLIEDWATTHKNGAWALSDVAKVYDVPPFKHIYVDSENGVPFFTSGELFKLERKADKFLSQTQTKGLEKYILDRGWILLARSGQLGGIICRPQLSDSALEGTATSDHVIRLVPTSGIVPPGYLFAYLAIVEIGYVLLSRTISGSSIPALWPTYLKALPIIKAPKPFMVEIDDTVQNAFEMRVQATTLEDQARTLVEQAIEQGAV